MSEKKQNWPVTLFIGITLGLALLIIMKNSLNPMNDRQLIKVKTDLKAIKYAIEQYKVRYGFYPKQSKDRLFDFAEQLSDKQPSADLKESRDMYIDFFEMNIGVTNENYAAPNADPTTLLDAWDEPYRYITDGESFTIWSSGADKVNSNTDGDDISQIAIARKKEDQK